MNGGCILPILSRFGACHLSSFAEVLISELNTQPARTPAVATPAVSPPPAYDSGPGWFARPFPYDSLIRNSMPVYPGAFSDPTIPVRP